MEYKDKFTLHIPHFSFKAGRLKQVDYRILEEKLLDSLNDIGLSSSYIVEASGRYKGRTYTEDLMTVFCTQEQAVIVENIINDSFANSNDTMQQESFAYEHNGTLYVYDLTQGKKG